MKTLRMAVALLLAILNLSNAKVVTAHGVFSTRGVSDAALVRSLPGFENGYAKVNGTRLHLCGGRERAAPHSAAGLAPDMVGISLNNAYAGCTIPRDRRRSARHGRLGQTPRWL